MQSGADIYPNFGISPWWALFSITILTIVVLINVFGAAFLRRLTLKKQSKSISIIKENKQEQINEALAKLQAIKGAYESKQISPSEAAFQVSQLTRATFDSLMQHSTIYQARYEISARKLESMTKLLDESYPPEFSLGTPSPISLNPVAFEKARGVIESCR